MIARTVSRLITRAELWNGNRESPGNALALHDPERSIIRWAWDGVGRYRRLYEPMLTDPTWAGLRRYRLRSRVEGATWLDVNAPDRSADHARPSSADRSAQHTDPFGPQQLR